MLVVFCLEKYSIANRTKILANMSVQMLANMLARFAGAFKSSNVSKTVCFNNATKQIGQV